MLSLIFSKIRVLFHPTPKEKIMGNDLIIL